MNLKPSEGRLTRPAWVILTEWPVPRLSTRRLDILTRIAQGMSEPEIGAELWLSRDAVKTHADRLCKALGARGRAHAVALAYLAGILPVPGAASVEAIA
jgi:DNA-binding NarL/FixJ family response regulator